MPSTLRRPAPVRPSKPAAAPPRQAASHPILQRFVAMTDKGGIGKSLVIQGLSMELEAAGIAHKVIEVETTCRLGDRLGDRVVYFEFQDADLDRLRLDPDLAGQFWDGVAEEFLAGTSLMDMSANATKAFWGWSRSGEVGEMMFGDGAGIGVLVCTTANSEAVALATQAMRQAAEAWPAARLFLVVSHHDGELPETAPLWDAICAAAGEGADEVVRIFLPACRAKVWPVVASLRRPLAEITEFDPREMVAHGFTLGVAARARTDVQAWFQAWRAQVRRILTAGGLPVAPPE